MKSTKRKFSISKLQKVAKILKTISHPVKLEILEILESNEPLDVSTICSKISNECEISMMSHHLAKMKDNGVSITIVTMREYGIAAGVKDNENENER